MIPISISDFLECVKSWLYLIFHYYVIKWNRFFYMRLLFLYFSPMVFSCCKTKEYYEKHFFTSRQKKRFVTELSKNYPAIIVGSKILFWKRNALMLKKTSQLWKMSHFEVCLVGRVINAVARQISMSKALNQYQYFLCWLDRLGKAWEAPGSSWQLWQSAKETVHGDADMES